MDHSLVNHIEYLGRAGRDIENAPARKWSSVIYRDNDAFARTGITHSNARAKWQCAVSGSESAVFYFLPTRGFASFIRIE
jgi:hypothetical protein